ncbi:S1C family serine protease [Crenothrix polyspora]|nr:serine protease [Crenothrix polyspora]
MAVFIPAQAQAEVSVLPSVLVKIKPSIVAVGTFMTKRSPRAQFLGTGFAVRDGSLVVTNAHVVASAVDTEHKEELAVFYRLADVEKSVLAKLVALDSVHDVAILKLQDAKLPPLTLGKASTVQEGQQYAFTGYPMGMVLGLYPVTHRGIVSAISPNIIPVLSASQITPKLLKNLQQPYNVFQLDATAYPGNSGSPLYNSETGEVVGIVNKVFVQESKESALSKPSGISYAVPVEYIEKLLNEKNLK